jgi:hypothetical protein
MLDTPERLAAGGGHKQDFAVLAGRSADSGKIQILVANLRVPGGYVVTAANLPWGDHAFRVTRHQITDSAGYRRTVEPEGRGGRFVVTGQLPAPSVELIVLEP